MDLPAFEELSNEISELTEVLCSWLKESGQPQPSFSNDSPSVFPQAQAPQAVQQAREKLIGAASQLHFLAQWPFAAAQSFANSHAFDAQSLRCIIHWKVAEHVPLHGRASFTNVAAKVDVDEERLTRVLRYAMTNHWFCEPEPGMLAHTAMSSLLLKDSAVLGQVTYQSQVGVPSSHSWLESIHASRSDESYQNSPFNIAFKTDQQSMSWALDDPVTSVWFNDMLRGYQRSSGFGLHHIIDMFDWAALGEALLVDVGGNTGTTAATIASVAPEMRFIVQDRPGPVAKGRTEIDTRLTTRIEFQEHDFFQDNPAANPDVFLLRNVLHDWPDQYAIIILQKLFKTMATSTKLLIVDSVVPAQGILPDSAEKSLRVLDMTMMTMMNSKERTADDWAALVQWVDISAKIKNIHRPAGSTLSMIEVVRHQL